MISQLESNEWEKNEHPNGVVKGTINEVNKKATG